jgi:uncharacterized membrane protein (DUF106 family)
MVDLTAIILANPKTSIITISFLATLFITILSYFMTNRDLLKQIKEKQKSLREEMKKYKDNPEKMMEINRQMMEDFPKQMKESMKISLVTIIPFILLFKWLKAIFIETTIASSWIWWYIIFSLIFSMILRKVFKLD